MITDRTKTHFGTQERPPSPSPQTTRGLLQGASCHRSGHKNDSGENLTPQLCCRAIKRGMKIKHTLVALALAALAPTFAFAQTGTDTGASTGTGTQTGSGMNRAQGTSDSTATETDGTASAGATTGTGTQTGSGMDRGAQDKAASPTPMP